MTTTPTPADRQLIDEQMAALRRLADVGLRLAEALGTDVVGAVTGVDEERGVLRGPGGQDAWIPLGPCRCSGTTSPWPMPASAARCA